MAEINVTPFVDVMLVLLIIFMVTAPMMDQGVEVDLPEVAEAPSLPVNKEPLVVTVEKNGIISIGKTKIDKVAKLTPVLQQALKGKADQEVFLEASPRNSHDSRIFREEFKYGCTRRVCTNFLLV